MEQTQFAWPPPKEKRADLENQAAQRKDFASNNDTPRRGEQQPSGKRIKRGTKSASMLRLFIDRADLGLNCFESVRLGHDYVLRTTVSNFQLQYGLLFHRRFEQVPGHGCSMVECVRYWLAPESCERARDLLGTAREDALPVRERGAV